MKIFRIIAVVLFCSLISLNVESEQPPPESEVQQVAQRSGGDESVQQNLQREKSNQQPITTRQKSFGQSRVSPLHAPNTCQEAGSLTKEECRYCEGLPGMICQANASVAEGP